MSASAPDGHELERVPDEELRPCEPVASEIGLDLLERCIAKSEAVDPHEALVLVSQHRGDEARAVEDAHFDVGFVAFQAGSREVEQREIVLPREILDLVGDRREATVDRVHRRREVLEEPRELLEEAIRVHRWLVTPARLGSSEGGSYQEYA